MEGNGYQVGELESRVSDYSASGYMASSSDSRTNYRECSTGGEIVSIEVVGEILLTFLSDSQAFDAELLIKAHPSPESHPPAVAAVHLFKPQLFWIVVQVRPHTKG